MKITGPVFMIVFDDLDVSPEVFAGERAEDCARQRFKRVLDNWNASLFQRIDDGVRSQSDVSPHAHAGSLTLDRGETCIKCGNDMHDPIHSSQSDTPE